MELIVVERLYEDKSNLLTIQKFLHLKILAGLDQFKIFMQPVCIPASFQLTWSKIYRFVTF
jgi:hypothetical protein